MSALGNMVITAITFPLVTRLGDTQQAWIEVSILYAIVSIIMLFICFKNCHERVKEETKTKDGKERSALDGHQALRHQQVLHHVLHARCVPVLL